MLVWPLDNPSKYYLSLKISFLVTDMPLIIITFSGCDWRCLWGL
jgi:hypothetical protein